MLLALVMFVLLGSAFGQQGSVNPKLLAPPDPALQLPIKDLRVTSSVITEVPSFGFFHPAECDDDGEIFFHLNHGSWNNMEVLKLKVVAGSAEPTTYAAPADFTANKTGFFINFAVTPSGELWMVGESLKQEFFLFKFDSEGKPIAQTKLAVPEHFDVQDFAVSDQGSVLVSGNFNHEAKADMSGRRYVALFDSNGRLQEEIDSKTDKIDLGSRGMHEGGVIYGADGRLYVLLPQSILVVTQAGTVERRIPFDKPKDFFATHLAISGGYLAIWLNKHNDHGLLTTQFLLIDVSTGESMARYNATAETGNAGLCFSRKDGFTMWRIENDRLNLLMANAH
jgi:hypothetical protein